MFANLDSQITVKYPQLNVAKKKQLTSVPVVLLVSQLNLGEPDVALEPYS